MVRRFFGWWFSELAALVPARLSGHSDQGQWLRVDLGQPRIRAVLEGPRQRVLLDLPADRAADLEQELAPVVASLDARRVRCRVSLPRGQVLVREFELPLAAEENLREVLSFEMSRRTPFRTEDVHFDYRIVARDSAAQRLTVRLEVAPRSAMAPVLAALREWNPEPSRSPSTRAEADADASTFAFQAAAFRPRPHARLNAALGLLLLVLAAAALWLPVERQREYRDALERQVDEARLAAAQVASLRNELAAERDARALIVGARKGRPSMVELLEALTRALPDGTYLFRLDVDGEELNLHGSSDGASGLIAILEAVPKLDRVRFASPVTRDGASGRERFHIVATLNAAPGAGAGG